LKKLLKNQYLFRKLFHEVVFDHCRKDPTTVHIIAFLSLSVQ